MRKNNDHRRQEVRQIVKNACDQLNQEGVDARNYVEQLAWLFFLKAFDEAETRKEEEAAFDDAPYERRLSGKFAWPSWAKDTDHPDQMLEFVQGKLWTKLTSPDPKKGLGDDLLAQRFRRIFENVRNYCRRGASFAKVVQHVDKLHFSDETDVHVLSELYEDLLKRVAADSAGYAGEFYTQRHIVRTMVEIVRPKAGERVYDPCFGTAGFLGEAADYIRGNGSLSGKQLENLQEHTFYGMENKPLTYLLGTMNMILHGIEAPNIVHTNTLSENLADIQEKDRFDIVLANPPFGGKERKEVQQNFPIKTGETAFLFLQHFIKRLRAGGRGAVVIKNTFLSNSDNASKALRQELLESCKLHTILDCPGGTFLGAGVKTVVLFFEKGAPTRKTWYYQLDPGRSLGKTNPLNEDDLAEFVKLQKEFVDSEKSWTAAIGDVNAETFDLSVKNPNAPEEDPIRSPEEILHEIETLDKESAKVLAGIRGML